MLTAWIWSHVPTWVEVGDDICLGNVQFERPVRSPRENAGPVAGYMGLINRKGFRTETSMALLSSLRPWRHRGGDNLHRSLRHFLKAHAPTLVTKKGEAVAFTYPVTAVSSFQNAWQGASQDFPLVKVLDKVKSKINHSTLILVIRGEVLVKPPIRSNLMTVVPLSILEDSE